MTNFEKILRETPRQDMAEALSACFEGQCDLCPAHALCVEYGEEDEVGCVDVLLKWLDMEAEGTVSEAFDLEGRCVASIVE